MSVILGGGEHRYRVLENWAKLPDGWEFKDAAAVACDSKDRVYVFNRGEHPMMVFDRDGNFLRSWGEGTFPRATGPLPGPVNGLPHNGPDAGGWVYVADRENHRVQVFDGNGRYETQWVNMHRPCGLYCCRGPRPQIIICELGW